MTMRWIVVAMLAAGCVNPNPTWERRSGGTLDISLFAVDDDGISAEEHFDEGDPSVRVELWQEERLNMRAPRERWVRVVAQDVVIDNLNCSPTADITLWWDNDVRGVSIRIEPTDTDDVIEGFQDGMNPQFFRYGFFRGEVWLEHPCIAEGLPTLLEYDTVWNLSERDRGLESPPVEQRR
jgi:hypothetical protein